MTYLILALYLAGVAVSYHFLDYWRRHQPHAVVPTPLIMTLSALWLLVAAVLIIKDLWQLGCRLVRRMMAYHRDVARGQEP